MLKKFKIISKIIEWIVFVFLLGILVIILSPFLPIKNIPKTFVVVTGSMEPFIKTGSVVFVKTVDPKTIKKGDIIAFTSPSNSKDTILHRVDSIKSTEPLRFSTKGDANNGPDAWDVMDVGIKGVYFGAIPYLGNAAAFVKTPLGFSLIIGLPALLFIISQLFNIRKTINDEVTKKVNQKLNEGKNDLPKTKINLKSIVLFIAIFSASFSLSSIHIIKASFSDTVSIGGIGLSVKDFIPPTNPTNLHWINPNISCGGHTNSYTITADWDNSTDNVGVVKYEYEITYPKIGGGIGVWNTFVTSSQHSGVFNQSEGLHTYRVRSYDAENNISEWSNSCSIIYDKTLPTSTITSPTSSNDFISPQVSFRPPRIWFWDGKIIGTATDLGSGVDHVELSIERDFAGIFWSGDTSRGINGWVNGAENTVRVVATGTTNWSYQINPFYLPIGKFKIVAHAVDQAGNTENSATIEFEYVDTPPCQPEVQFSKNNGRASFTATCISDYSKLDYELTYLSDNNEKGLGGSIDINNQSEIIRDNLILGSCSALREVCSYDLNVTNLKLKIDLISQNGETVTITKNLP